MPVIVRSQVMNVMLQEQNKPAKDQHTSWVVPDEDIRGIGMSYSPATMDQQALMEEGWRNIVLTYHVYYMGIA